MLGQDMNEEMQNGGQDVSAYEDEGFSGSPLGGKKRRSRKGSRRTAKKSKKSKKVKRSKTAKKGKKGKKGASAWITHVKAFCKKTGKTFPEALKDPACRKSFKK
jgi:hypothetical protein